LLIVYQSRHPKQGELTRAQRGAADRGEYRQAAGAVTQAGYLVPVSLNHILILINDL
jgi:hypothetical protein